MKELLIKFITAWDKFWFSPRSLDQLALFRIMLCGTLFLLALDRHSQIFEFYSEQGLVPVNIALDIYEKFNRPLFVLAQWPDSLIGPLHGILVVSLLLLTLGLGGRLLCAAAWLLHLAFLQRNYSIAFGADVIGGIFLFYLIGTQSCARLSVKSLFSKGRSTAKSSDILTQAFYRLIQVQICVVYAFTGFEKLKGASWWDGSALWTVFANSQMMIADFTWLRHFPWVIIGLSFGTILFEIYFPVLVWLCRWRRVVLGAGIFFHLGIGLMMGLWGFSLIMLAPYFLFWNPEAKIGQPVVSN